jgi:3',5'-cyclic AMP phosphodiesterase CpdA
MGFDATRSYTYELDARGADDWLPRLQQERPNGVFWPLVGPRRWGKTWMLKRLEHESPRGWATFIDLRAPNSLTLLQKHRGNGGCLLLDEPGPLILRHTEDFLTSCGRLRQRGVQIVAAMTPNEWEVLTAADKSGSLVQVRDRRTLRPLTESEAEKLARVPWALELLSKLPSRWKRSPFLLELLFEVAENSPGLRADVPGLIRATMAKTREDRFAYVYHVFQEGLSDSQRKTVRALARGDTATAAQSGLLRSCGLLDGTDDRPTIADPVIADHLPPPLVIHHISDVHVGIKSAPALDVKERGRIGARLGAALGETLVRDTYLNHVAGLSAQRQGPNVILVSGDLGETGSNDELAEARKWLDRLCTFLNEHPDVSSGSPRLLVVGGNHDVDWTKVNEPAGERSRHHNFRDTMAGIPHPPLDQPPETRSLMVVSFADSGLEVVLLGSAELGGEVATDSDVDDMLRAVDGLKIDATVALAADDWARYDALRARIGRVDPGLVHQRDLRRVEQHRWRQPVRLAVLHHPVSPLPVAPEIARFSGLLNSGEVKDVLLRVGVCLVLHGHTHSGWCAHETWPERHGQKVLTVLGAPSLGSREIQENLGYNEIRVRREGDSTYEVSVRRFVRRGVDWAAAGDPIPVPLPPAAMPPQTRLA